MHPDHLSFQLAESTVNRSECLGFSPTTPTDRCARGETPCGGFTSRRPRGVPARGFGTWRLVETVLDDLGDTHRVIAALEFGVLRPQGEPLKSQKERAAAAGISLAVYTGKLKQVRERLELADKQARQQVDGPMGRKRL